MTANISRISNLSNPNVQTTLKATDNLNRELPAAESVGETKPNKQVGLFYFLWLGDGEHDDDRKRIISPLDVTKILLADAEAGYKPDSNVWGKYGTSHHWGEALFGYYHSRDEWVVRRHIEMLTHADIDFLFFDTTNAQIYEENAKLVMKWLEFYRNEGWNTPKVVFYTNTESGKTVEKIYEAVYKPEYMKGSWYCADGKPLIIAQSIDCSEEMRKYFAIREAQWPNEPSKAAGWPWMDFERPQRVFYNEKNEAEIINVSVAQHPQIFHGDSAMYGETANRGRSFHDGKEDMGKKAYLYGYNFKEQWEHAIECDVPFVLITGWNEWIMGRWNGSRPDRPIGFVDCANVEYSRDCEPMKGGYSDNYYMQMIQYIRKYKGVKPIATEKSMITIDITGGFEQWDCVEKEYRDFSNGALPRNCTGYGGIYRDNTGNNEIILSKCAHDGENIYFYAKTSKDITPCEYNGMTWLNLYIKVNEDGKNTAYIRENWHGYNYIANYFVLSENITTLAEYGDGEFEIMSGLPYKLKNNEFMICIPKEKLKIKDKDIFEIEFKWADGKTRFESIDDLYTKGDCAPIGRLNYVFKAVNI